MVYQMDYLIFIFVLLMLLIASIQDFRNREVPDSISYILMAGTLLLSFIYSLAYNTISNLIYIPISLLLLFGFSYFMYRLGQWGGGDVKLMLGLSFVFTSLNVFSDKSFIALFINILLFGGIYGLIGTILFGLVKINKLKKHFQRYDVPFFVASAAIIILSVLLVPFPINIFIAVGVFMIFSIRFVFLVANNLMYIQEKVSKLTEGDWLAESPKDSNGKKIVPERSTGLTNADIQKLKEKGIKEVIIKIGLPFVPGIFFAVIITVLLGNPFLQLFSAL
ncbi:MAG: A24 family peptidase [Candidatus Parvarchaeota archaeon]|jgi:Type IV leader peptidase family.|nr:A24 family peptidase [Candidatus Parvarchaeota archaeon]MCW1294334.1 A24 family peptidase [Candidatus Parvarchaeum tengchongense]MCW1295635.1 A24 family peptidase [Candidatus Parvarchaeum tengchongense]MCW1298727.1 A24 family peptidase [Candidatus Parvarchaeum tengchongense]MCW1312392.1 A24 family peptidase [Candidatus Parvarchaeum tengchongense]